MSLEAKRISILKTEIPAGLVPLVLSGLKMHKKSNGEIILFEDNPGVIVSFKCTMIKLGIKDSESIEDKTHQELYWIGSTNYTKLQRIILQVGLDPSVQISKKEIVNKKIWGLIKEINYMRGTDKLRTEFKLIETWEWSDSPPKSKHEIVEFRQEGF